MSKKLKFLFASTVFAGSIGVSGAAYAQETLADTDVNNTVSVDYTVGGINNNVTANNTFKVDRRVSYVLAETGLIGRTQVSSNTVNQVTQFQLTNSSNDRITFPLTTGSFAGFTLGNVRIFADNGPGSAGAFDISDDALVTSVTLDPGSNITLFVVADIPAGLADGATADFILSVTANNLMGTNLADRVTPSVLIVDQTNDVNDQLATQSVFFNITSSDGDGYIVQIPFIDPVTGVIKSVRIVDDNNAATTTPGADKNLPGALVEYCISVANTGSSPANNVRVRDALPSEITPSGQITFDGIGAADVNGICPAGGSTQPFAGTAPEVDVTLTIPAGETRNIIFRATIN